WLPPVFLLWANLHGAVVVGGVVVASVLVTAWIWDRARVRPLAMAAAFAGLATLVTPLGSGILGLVFGMSNEADIAEWEPAWRSMPAGLVFGAVVVGTAIAVVVIRRRRPLVWSDRVLVAAAVAVLPLAVRYSRVMPMFVVIALPLLARGWQTWKPARRRREDRSAFHGAALGLVVLRAAVWLASAWVDPGPSLDWR